MQKIARYIFYLSFLFFYNVTTLYSSLVHDHEFSWEDDESCSAYIISISQNSDTFPLFINHNIKAPKEKIFNLHSYEADINFEFINDISTRAPPVVD